MTTKLIPNTITVSEQFALRTRYDNVCNNWRKSKHHNFSQYWAPTDLEELEKDSGIRCQVIHLPTGSQLTNYELVNEKQHAWFMLQWS